MDLGIRFNSHIEWETYPVGTKPRFKSLTRGFIITCILPLLIPDDEFSSKGDQSFYNIRIEKLSEGKCVPIYIFPFVKPKRTEWKKETMSENPPFSHSNL